MCSGLMSQNSPSSPKEGCLINSRRSTMSQIKENFKSYALASNIKVPFPTGPMILKNVLDHEASKI